jgi:hypothetical protein
MTGLKNALPSFVLYCCPRTQAAMVVAGTPVARAASGYE